MDERDETILEILREDGRAPFTEIADRIGVSEGTVRNRVQKLKEEDVIDHFTVQTDHGASAVVLVDLSTEEDIDSIVARFPEGIRVYEIAGEHDMVLQFSRSSRDELNEAIDAVRSVDGVVDTTTYTVLKTRDT
jgi:DNA-binding Lrp family transcriptional regulator